MAEREQDLRDKTTESAKHIGTLMVLTAVFFQAARELLLPGTGLWLGGVIFERKKAHA